MNYTVHIPPTPDNQPMDTSVAAKAEEQYVSNSLFTGGFNSVTRAHLMDKVTDLDSRDPQMKGASSCSMPACDGKVITDERGHEVIPCECRFKICRDCYMDAQKENGLCPGCKEPYRNAEFDDNIPDFSNGALPLPAPDKSGDRRVMKRPQDADFSHNKWLFETQGTYGHGTAYWPPEDVYSGEGE
ncbi:Cellulose synthase-like protein, partial [Drosera capensis]